MPAPSFRLKLALVMSLLVGAISAATLFVTHRHVRQTYDVLLRQEFAIETRAFAEGQEFRLRVLKEECVRLAGGVRMVAALEERDSEVIYQTLRDQLGLAGLGQLKSGTNEGGTLRASEGIVALVLDSEGNLIEQPAADATPDRNSLARDLHPIRQALAGVTTQQVGYLAFTKDGASVLHEMVITPAVDPVSGGRKGALLVGLPVNENSYRTTPISNGLWTRDQLYAPALTEPIRDKLRAEVPAALLKRGESDVNFEIEQNGALYRVFLWALNPRSPFPPVWQVGLFSLDGYVRQTAELRARILGFGLAGLLLGLLLSSILAHQLSVPLRELVAGTFEIKRGNYAARVLARSRDELGQLAGSFNEMAEGLALKEKYRNVLDMVADQQVADQLLRGEVRLGGELRPVTILFCDIRGFTALTQGMPPENVIALLNEHMTALTRVVYEHQGVVDKFVGDLVMALFGAPTSYGDDALRAARCALRMIDERERLNAHSKTPVQIGIGIATGEVVAGCMGATNRVDYTVLGERVNLASRLCGQAQAGEVLVDQTTHGLLKDQFGSLELSPRPLKGFAEPVRVWKLGRAIAELKTS